jgi:hypothetical protein
MAGSCGKKVENSLENHDIFFQVSLLFQPSFDNISAICWSIWMANSFLETLLVVNYMTEIWI